MSLCERELAILSLFIRGKSKMCWYFSKGVKYFSNIIFSERRIQITRRYLSFQDDLLIILVTSYVVTLPFSGSSVFLPYLKIMFEIFFKALGIRKYQKNIKTGCQCHCFLCFSNLPAFQILCIWFIVNSKALSVIWQLFIKHVLLSGTFSPQGYSGQ